MGREKGKGAEKRRMEKWRKEVVPSSFRMWLRPCVCHTFSIKYGRLLEYWNTIIQTFISAVWPAWSVTSMYGLTIKSSCRTVT